MTRGPSRPGTLRPICRTLHRIEPDCFTTHASVFTNRHCETVLSGGLSGGARQETASLLFLQIANCRNYSLDVIRAQALSRECVGGFLGCSTISDHVGNLSVGEFLCVVRDQTGNLGCRFAGSVSAMAHCTLCFVKASAIVGPREVGNQDEQCHCDGHHKSYQLRHLHDFFSP